jgi:hypothetical protein
MKGITVFRKFFAIILSLSLFAVVTACSSSSSTTPGAAVVTAVPAAPVSLDGDWAMSEPAPGFNMTANISGGIIEVSWISDDTRALYWVGTFPTVAPPVGEKIVSVGNVDDMASSILASTEASKPFTYTGDTLDYEFSMLGVSKVIHLKK